jgi:pyrroline-5-carboxylate reductase
MFDKIIGFIGAGNMGSAILGGILNSSLATSSQIIVSAHSTATLERIRSRYSVETTLSNERVAERSDLLFLAVKPDKYEEVIPQIAHSLLPSCIIISLAAGQTLSSVRQAFGRDVKIVRAMPNTPARVGEAMSALCANEAVTPQELALVQDLFACFGKSEVIPERLMDAVVGISGSSPAYVYLFIEAMADAAVADGMPRAQAYKFAAQSVYGAAKMVLETGEHPAVLKDAVCSPGGTTIEAVASLERDGFRNAVITAQRACTAKSREMSRKKESS